MKVAFTRSSTIYDESRATKEIFAFLEQGYDVVVFGWDRKGDAKRQCESLFKSYSSHITFNFYKGNIGNGAVQKIASRLKWNQWLSKELSKSNNINVIHACDYDTGGAVRRVAKKRGKLYVYDIYDYYVDAHPVPTFLKNAIEKDEIRTINDAIATIICTEERKAQINKAKPQKMVVIHNSPDVEKPLSKEEEYDYAYCGALFDGRLVKEILDAYSNHTNFKFIVAGSGTYADLAKSMDKEYVNLTYKGAIPYSEVLEIETRSKVISAVYEPTIRNHQLCAPNKFYEALALGKPLIVCRGTGIDKVVEENEIGLVIDYNAEEFYYALKRLCDDSNLRLEMGIRARSLYEKRFRWTIMKERLIEIYRALPE